MTQIESKPTSSAWRTIWASVGPIAAVAARPRERVDLEAELHGRGAYSRAPLRAQRVAGRPGSSARWAGIPAIQRGRPARSFLRLVTRWANQGMSGPAEPFLPPFAHVVVGNDEPGARTARSLLRSPTR